MLRGVVRFLTHKAPRFCHNGVVLGVGNMKVKMSSHDNVTVVELSGYLDFGSARPIAEHLESIYLLNQNAKIVIDMSDLEFVGSSGISNFVKGLRGFNKLHMRPSYCGVKVEFQKLFKIFEEKNCFEVHNDRGIAVQSANERFEHWQMRTLRSAETH
jgi:anti-anti-sigma factor